MAQDGGRSRNAIHPPGSRHNVARRRAEVVLRACAILQREALARTSCPHAVPTARALSRFASYSFRSALRDGGVKALNALRRSLRPSRVDNRTGENAMCPSRCPLAPRPQRKMRGVRLDIHGTSLGQRARSAPAAPAKMMPRCHIGVRRMADPYQTQFLLRPRPDAIDDRIPPGQRFGFGERCIDVLRFRVPPTHAHTEDEDGTLWRGWLRDERLGGK